MRDRRSVAPPANPAVDGYWFSADNRADNCVFATGDNATAANRPTLSITYDCP